MSNWPIRRLNVLSIPLLVLASLGLFVSSANSEPDLRGNSSDGDAKLQARVARLEQRLAELEERLDLVEVGERAASRSAPSVKRSTATESKRAADSCASPSYLDASGVRRVRAECAQGTSAGNCETPFVVDPDGIKRVKIDCL